MKRCFHIVFLMAAPFFVAYSQSVSLSAGAALFPDFLTRNYEFRYYSASSPVRTSVFGTAGITYSPLPLIGETKVAISIDVIFGVASTGPVQVYNGLYTARMDDMMVFTGLWTKFYVPATLSPFIRLGMGVLYGNLEETYTSNPLDNRRDKYSRVALAGGGGADVAITDMITLSFFAEGVFTPDKPLTSFSVLGVRLLLTL